MHSKHFSDEELRCKCGCGRNFATPKLLELAEACRAILGAAMIIGTTKDGHSVCRCEKHNAEVGGVKGSYHTQGKAMDFHVKGWDPDVVFRTLVAYQKGGQLPLLGGIGVYDWGVHIDTGRSADGHLRIWDYRSKNHD